MSESLELQLIGEIFNYRQTKLKDLISPKKERSHKTTKSQEQIGWTVVYKSSSHAILNKTDNTDKLNTFLGGYD